MAFRNASFALILCSSPAVAEPVVVAALGDSLTQGFGLAPDQGLVPQLERWLKAEGADVRLINAGVSGDTTAGGLARVGWTLTPEVEAVMVALGGNDMLRGLDPGQARSNLAGILTAVSTAELPAMLVGLEAPTNYGPDYKLAFDLAYVDLATEFGTVFVPDMLGPIRSQPDITAYLQGDMIHPNADGVALMVAELGPKLLDLIAEVEARR